MKHSLLPALVLLAALPACGGGGGGDPITVITGLARTAGCTADNIEAYAAVAAAVGDELQKSPVPTNLNVNVVVDGKSVVLTGTITQAAGDLSDGLDVGDTAEIVISSLTVDGVVTGSGNLVFNFETANRLILVGTVEFADGSCTMEINGLNLVSDPAVDGYPTGFVSFTTTSGDDVLTGSIEPDGTADAPVNASLNEGPTINFTLNLDTFNVDLS